MNPTFKKTMRQLQKLPGVGPRQAARFVLALLEKEQSELDDLGQAILSLKKNIKLCRNCFNLAEDGLCHVCGDPKRDQKKIMVVEKVTDLDSIEKAGLYRGLYHVLGGAINPLEGLTVENLRFKELQQRLNKNNILQTELIIATNTNATGETTALYIREQFDNKPGINITRLARGLASGSNLEYADEATLRNALEFRK